MTRKKPCATKAKKKRFTIAQREAAERRVLSVRGSYDAPGFDACVEAEMEKQDDGGRP